MNMSKSNVQSEKKAKNYKIYCYTNKINNKKHIGLTSLTIKERAGKNGRNYKDCTHFWNAIQKYGWDNFINEIIVNNLSLEEAKAAEKYYIKFYNTNNPKLGYNISLGGDGAFGIIRDKVYKDKFRYGNNGIARKVICITTNTTFDSISRACEYYNLKYHANLSRACKHGTSCGKLNGEPLFWAYLSDDNSYVYKEKIYSNIPKPVMCITTNKRFQSIKTAARYYNIRHDGISLCCREKAKSAGKLKNGTLLVWKWA